MTPSRAKAQKAADNRRAYVSRLRKNPGGTQTMEQQRREDTKTPECIKYANLGGRAPRLEPVETRLPDNTIVAIREYSDTPESLAAVARIMKGGAK